MRLITLTNDYHRTEARLRPTVLDARWVAHGCTIYTVDDWRDGTNLGGLFVASTYSREAEEADDMPSREDMGRAARIATEHNAAIEAAEIEDGGPYDDGTQNT